MKIVKEIAPTGMSLEQARHDADLFATHFDQPCVVYRLTYVYNKRQQFDWATQGSVDSALWIPAEVAEIVYSTKESE